MNNGIFQRDRVFTPFFEDHISIPDDQSIPNRAVFTVPWSFYNIPPFLCWIDHLGSAEEIKSHLPEQRVYGISDHPRESGPEGIVVEMGDSEILLNNVPDFGDGFIPIYSMLGEV